MATELERRLRDAFDRDAQGARLVNPGAPRVPEPRPLPGDPEGVRPRPRPRTIGFLALAACLLAVVVLAAALVARPQPVDTVDHPPDECPSTTQQQAITPGGPMNTRLAGPVVSAAAAIMLIGACGDDDAAGPRLLAQGEDVNFVGVTTGLQDRTMDLIAEEDDGVVSGEVRFERTDDPALATAASLECEDTDTDGVVILGGVITEIDFEDEAEGEFLAVAIFEGEPDRLLLWFDFGESGAASCEEFLDSLPEDLTADIDIAEVADGDDIETG